MKKRRWWIVPLAVAGAGVAALVAVVASAKEKVIDEDVPSGQLAPRTDLHIDLALCDVSRTDRPAENIATDACRKLWPKLGDAWMTGYPPEYAAAMEAAYQYVVGRWQAIATRVAAGEDLAAICAALRARKDKRDRYKGKPGLPGKLEPVDVPEDEPETIDATDLWIAPDCSAFVAGSRWEADTARPAIRAWIADGYVDRNQWHHWVVVRGVLTPYSPLCLDVFPWADVAAQAGIDADTFNAQLREAQATYPDMAYLVGRVHSLYLDELEASGEAPEGTAPQPTPQA